MTTRTVILAMGLGAFLLGGPAYAGVDQAALCKDKKARATGKKTLSLLKAFGTNAKVPNSAKYTQNVSKAQSKFTKAFTRAEFTGSGQPRGCETVDDADAIETMVDTFVADLTQAKAKEVTNINECVKGPLSRCRVGDYILENSRIRVVIQDVQRNLMGIAQYGGHIIDADVRRANPADERDNFEEWATAINIENTDHYTDITIINDGTDGNPAIIRATGPDDLLDFLNPSSVVSSFGFLLPAARDDTDLPVEFSTDYILEPGNNWVQVETTVKNTSGSVVSTYFGEFLNGSGQVDLFQPGYGFGETLVTTACPAAATNPCDAIIYRGVDEASGVSYGYVHEDIGTMVFATGTTAFTASGVTVPILGREIALVLVGASPANFTLQPDGNPGDSQTKTRYFVVGNGTVSSILDARNEIKGITRGTLSGQVTTTSAGPAAGADVAVIGITAQGPNSLGAITRNVVNHTETDADGNYSLTLPPGSYDVVVNKDGHPYQGGGATPALNPVVITADATTTLDVTLPDAGSLQVTASDGVGDIPAKASVVGFDPSPDLTSTQSIIGLIQNTTNVFRDRVQDGLPFGVTRVMFIEPTGTSDVVPIEPGSYEVFVSRGPEYSIDSDSVVVSANNLSTFDATLARVVDTTGFVSGDFHVHSIHSPDSEVTERERIVSMMSEGLEFFTPSDHDNRRDFQGTVVTEGWGSLVTTATGNEMTTFDYGHFNSWPMTIDTSKVNGGSVDHGGEVATAGEDFPSFGNYNLTPEELINAAKADPGFEVVQINHFSSHFGLDAGGTDLGSGLAVDTGLEPPKSSVPPQARRLDPAEEDIDQGYFTDAFDALELWIGASRGQILDNFLGQNAGDWFNLLNQGIVRTGIADSDTHQRINTQSGIPRTMIASSEEDLTMLDPETLASTVLSGRVLGTNGPMVRVTVEALESGSTASLEDGDSTIVTASDGEVEITVDVQSPTWAEFDTIEFYLNSTTIQTIIPDVETGAGEVDVARYGIAPDVIHGTADVVVKDQLFTRTTQSVSGGSRFEATTTLTLAGGSALTEDTWIVVMVKGSDGISKPLFPMIPNSLQQSGNTTLADLIDGNLGESGILALGFTNPIFVDVDGGGYDAPGVQCVTEDPPHPTCVTTSTTTTTTTSTTTTTL